MALRYHERQKIAYFFDRKIRYKVEVCEGFSTPHFYVEPENMAQEFALRIDKPDYWFTNASVYGVTYMNGTIAKSLMDFLKSKTGDITYWQKIVNTWNDLNPEHKVNEGIKMPDYTKTVFSNEVYNRWKSRIDEINNKMVKDFEDSIPKYDYACLNCLGSGIESCNSIMEFAKKGFRVVAAVQGSDCCQPLIIMERPAPKNLVMADEIPENEFIKEK